MVKLLRRSQDVSGYASRFLNFLGLIKFKKVKEVKLVKGKEGKVITETCFVENNKKKIQLPYKKWLI